MFACLSNKLPNRCVFFFIINYQEVFQNDCTILHSSQHWMSVPGAPLPSHVYTVGFSNVSHSAGYEMVSHRDF